jgi:spermidine synthase
VSALLSLGLVAAAAALEAQSGSSAFGLGNGAGLVMAGGVALGVLALGVLLARGRLLRLFEPSPEAAAREESRLARHPYVTLFVASFAALFVEVMLIRYAGSQIRVFSFYKNVPLVASYLGLGIGCWLAGGRARHALGFLFWLVPLAVFLGVGSIAAHDWLSAWAAGASSEHILGDVAREPTGTERMLAQAFMAAFCVATLVTITLLFTLLGRLLGDAFERVPRLPAYTTNILGSLAGILGFVGLSVLETPPWIWFPLGLLSLGWWLCRPVERVVGAALVALVTLSVMPQFGDTVWSRYQKLVGHTIAAGPGGTGSKSPGYMVEISDVFYQVAVDLRPEAVEEMGENPFPHYDMAMGVLAPGADVLIVGAGTGNDVAAALRAGAARVDAVDIDPAIVEMGRRHHPEAPYDDTRVRVLVDDARSAFQSLPHGSYDAVVFGLLDSHTQLGMSSVRLDNYVFTMESLEAVRRLLRPGGTIILTAATFRPWFQERFAHMLGATCDGKVAIASHHVWTSYACQVANPRLPASTASSVPAGVVVPTDDWPFLYLPTRGIPVAYLIVVALLIVASLAVLRAKGLRARQWTPSLGHMFFLGAAFLLMEVHAVNRLALLFGTTWLVSAVTIALVLTLIVAANLTVPLLRGAVYKVAYPCLVVTLLLSFSVEPGSILGASTGAALLFGLLLLLPVYFAGIVFAKSFSETAQAGPAIAANMFGAAVGGWVEYLSMAVGFRALVLLALCFYAASLLMHLRDAEQRSAAGPDAEPLLDAEPTTA